LNTFNFIKTLHFSKFW